MGTLSSRTKKPGAAPVVLVEVVVDWHLIGLLRDKGVELMRRDQVNDAIETAARVGASCVIVRLPRAMAPVAGWLRSAYDVGCDDPTPLPQPRPVPIVAIVDDPAYHPGFDAIVLAHDARAIDEMLAAHQPTCQMPMATTG